VTQNGTEYISRPIGLFFRVLAWMFCSGACIGGVIGFFVGMWVG
jgi:hypothetical protein